MPIVLQDQSGLAQGISTAGSALAGALQQRAENSLAKRKEDKKREEQRTGMELVSNWATNYDQTKSPMENVGALQTALASSNLDPSTYQSLLNDVMKKSISQQGDQYATDQLMGTTRENAEVSEASESPIEVSDELESPTGKPLKENAIATSPIEAETKPTSEPEKTGMERFNNAELVKLSGSPNKGVQNLAKAEQNNRKLEQASLKADRDYHSKYTFEQDKKAASLRDSIPKKRAALAHSKQAIMSGQVGFMSGNWLADKTGIERFRGVEGAQLEVAAKEHFFGNMAKVSAKAQNQWFEKLLRNMFAQVGQTKETSMTFNEMLEAEINAEEAYVKAYSRISKEDEEKYTYTRKDAEQRARAEIEHIEEINLDRALYRVKRLSEGSMSSKEMQKTLLDPVDDGTPLTLERKFMFLDRFDGDAKEAIRAAKKLGYTIPKKEEIHLYTMPSRQFMKQMGGE